MNGYTKKLTHEMAETAGFEKVETVAGHSGMSWQFGVCRLWDSNGRGEWCVAFEREDGTLEHHTYFHDVAFALSWAREKALERMGYEKDEDGEKYVKGGVRQAHVWYDMERKQWAAGQFDGWSGLTEVRHGTFTEMLEYAESFVDDPQWYDETDDEGNFEFATGDMYDYLVFVEMQRGGRDMVVGYESRVHGKTEMPLPQGVETVEQAKAHIEAYMREQWG